MCSRISHGVTVSAKRYRVRPLGGAPGSCSGRLGSDLLCVAAIGGDYRSRDQLRLRIPLAGAHERKIQQLQTAPRGGHHLHSLAFRSGVARNDLQCNARMIIIVLRMIAEPLGGLRTHVHVLARAVLHEGFQQRACQVSGHALNGEAGRGDYLASESFALMNHIQSMSDCTSRIALEVVARYARAQRERMTVMAAAAQSAAAESCAHELLPGVFADAIDPGTGNLRRSPPRTADRSPACLSNYRARLRGAVPDTFSPIRLHRVKFGCTSVLLTSLRVSAIVFRAGRKSRLLRLLVLALATIRLGSGAHPYDR